MLNSIKTNFISIYNILLDYTKNIRTMYIPKNKNYCAVVTDQEGHETIELNDFYRDVFFTEVRFLNIQKKRFKIKIYLNNEERDIEVITRVDLNKSNLFLDIEKNTNIFESDILPKKIVKKIQNKISNKCFNKTSEIINDISDILIDTVPVLSPYKINFN